MSSPSQTADQIDSAYTYTHLWSDHVLFMVMSHGVLMKLYYENLVFDEKESGN